MDFREFNDFGLPSSQCRYEAKRLVIAELLQRGYEVFKSGDHHNSSCLVIGKDERWFRIQVRIQVKTNPEAEIKPGKQDELVWFDEETQVVACVDVGKRTVTYEPLLTDVLLEN
jgi:hypothetical protein